MDGEPADEAGFERTDGAVAQLGEHLLCKQGVSGSIPLSSTIDLMVVWQTFDGCVAITVARHGSVTEGILEKKKGLRRLLKPGVCYEYIVKRRYVWRLPGAAAFEAGASEAGTDRARQRV
jgi:hypothetical protein